MNSLARAAKEVAKAGSRSFASSAFPDRKVAVLGAAGRTSKADALWNNRISWLLLVNGRSPGLRPMKVFLSILSRYILPNDRKRLTSVPQPPQGASASLFLSS